MQRPDRRQVRNLRHAKPLTGIVAELPLEGQHPRSCQTVSPRLVFLNLIPTLTLKRAPKLSAW